MSMAMFGWRVCLEFQNVVTTMKGVTVSWMSLAMCAGNKFEGECKKVLKVSLK